MLQGEDESLQGINAVTEATHVEVQTLKARNNPNAIGAPIQEYNRIHKSKRLEGFNLRPESRNRNTVIVDGRQDLFMCGLGVINTNRRAPSPRTQLNRHPRPTTAAARGKLDSVMPPFSSTAMPSRPRQWHRPTA